MVYADEAAPAQTFTYTLTGRLASVTDTAGSRAFSYNEYDELVSDCLTADEIPHLITENRDGFGRSIGFAYSKAGGPASAEQYGYGTDGRLSSAAFMHGGESKQFSYAYLPGTHLLHTLTMPNGMTLMQQYEVQRDLLTGMFYKRGETSVVERFYSYDALGRPQTRQQNRQGGTRQDAFTHNERSELIAATYSSNGNTQSYAYAYDNIGNHKTAQENAEEATAYTANALNQYTAVGAFTPTYDADGNQTKVKTSTGIWNVTYNAENRPTQFTRSNADGSTTRITCAYDYMGRRATKKVETIAADATASTNLHQRYIYRDFLQIACCDLTRDNHPHLWFITWDPTQPVATRPLALRKDGTWYCYGWDLTKNICEVFSNEGYLNNTVTYSYTPYGAVTAEGNVQQPLQWSSEFYDNELGLVYYNFRHYNPSDGRWLGRDFIASLSGLSLYSYVNSACDFDVDILGAFSEKDSNAISPAECLNRRLKLERAIDRLVNKCAGSEVNCPRSEGCTKLSFIVEMGDPCEPYPQSKAGHAGVAIGEKFRDFGPTSKKDMRGNSWWGRQINSKNPQNVTLSEVINWMGSEVGRQSVPDVTVMVEFCACRQLSQDMLNYWDELYLKIKNNTAPKWKAPGFHCTSSLCQSLDGKGVRGYMDPRYFLEHVLTNLRHQCGPNRGGKVRMKKLLSYFY